MESGRIRRLEEIADRAWPPREVHREDDWEARFSDGMHRRLNSAAVWPQADLPAVIDRIEAWYAARSAPPIFKLTRASAPGLDTALAERGYERDARVAIMTASLPGRPAPPRHPVELSPSPSRQWSDAFAAVSGYGPDRRRLLGEILDRIRMPAAYAAVRSGDRLVAMGMAVAEDAYAGVFEMATDPGRRNEGMAGSVLAALLGWMGERGVATAYLQVLAGNIPAERLYRSAGFAVRYHYWYRVRPGGLAALPR